MRNPKVDHTLEEKERTSQLLPCRRRRARREQMLAGAEEETVPGQALQQVSPSSGSLGGEEADVQAGG